MNITLKKHKDYAQIFVDGSLKAVAVALTNGRWRLKDLNDSYITAVSYKTPNAAKKAFADLAGLI